MWPSLGNLAGAAGHLSSRASKIANSILDADDDERGRVKEKHSPRSSEDGTAHWRSDEVYNGSPHDEGYRQSRDEAVIHRRRGRDGHMGSTLSRQDSIGSASSSPSQADQGSHTGSVNETSSSRKGRFGGRAWISGASSLMGTATGYLEKIAQNVAGAEEYEDALNSEALQYKEQVGQLKSRLLETIQAHEEEQLQLEQEHQVQVSQLQEEIRALRQEYQKSQRGSRKEMSHEVEGGQSEEVLRLRKELATAEDAAEEYKRKMEALQATLSNPTPSGTTASEGEKHQLEEQVHELELKCHKLEQKLMGQHVVEAGKIQAVTEEKDHEIAQLQEDNLKLQELLAQSMTKVDGLQSQTKDLKVLREQCTSQEAKLAKLQKELLKREAEVEELMEQLSSGGGTGSSQAQAKELERTVQRLQQELMEARGEADAASVSLAERDTFWIKELEAERSKRGMELKELQALLETEVAKRQETEAKLQALLEQPTSPGEGEDVECLKRVIADKETAAQQQEAEHVAEVNALKTSLSQEQETVAQLRHVLGEAQAKGSEVSALQSKLREAEEQLASLQVHCQQLEQRQQMQHSEAASKLQGEVTRLNKREAELEKEVLDKAETIESLKAELLSYSKTSQEHQAALEEAEEKLVKQQGTLQMQIHELGIKLGESERRELEARKDAQAAREQHAHLEGELSLLRDSLSSAQEELKATAQSLQVAKNFLMVEERDHSQTQQEKDALQEEYDHLETKMKEMEVSFRQQLEASKVHEDHLKHQLKEALTAASSKGGSGTAADNRVEQLSKMLKSEQDAHEDTRSRLTQASKNHQEVMEKLQDELQIERQSNTKSSQDVDRLTQDLGRLKASMSGFDKEKAAARELQEKLLEEQQKNKDAEVEIRKLTLDVQQLSDLPRALAQEREAMEKLQHELLGEQQRHAKATQEVVKLSRELKQVPKLQNHLEKEKEAVQKLTSELNNLRRQHQKELASTQQELVLVQGELSAQQKVNQELLDAKIALLEANERLQRELGAQVAQVQELDLRLVAVESDNKHHEVQAELNKHVELCAALAAERNEVQTVCENVSAELERSKEQCGLLEQKVGDLQRLVQVKQQEVDDAVALLKEHTALGNVSQGELEHLKALLEEEKEFHEASQARVQELEAEVRETVNLEHHQKILADLTAQLEESEKAQTRLREEMQLMQQQEGRLSPLINQLESEKQLRMEIEKKLEEMGMTADQVEQMRARVRDLEQQLAVEASQHGDVRREVEVLRNQMTRLKQDALSHSQQLEEVDAQWRQELNDVTVKHQEVLEQRNVMWQKKVLEKENEGKSVLAEVERDWKFQLEKHQALNAELTSQIQNLQEMICLKETEAAAQGVEVRDSLSAMKAGNEKLRDRVAQLEQFLEQERSRASNSLQERDAFWKAELAEKVKAYMQLKDDMEKLEDKQVKSAVRQREEEDEIQRLRRGLQRTQEELLAQKALHSELSQLLETTQQMLARAEDAAAVAADMHRQSEVKLEQQVQQLQADALRLQQERRGMEQLVQDLQQQLATVQVEAAGQVAGRSVMSTEVVELLAAEKEEKARLEEACRDLHERLQDLEFGYAQLQESLGQLPEVEGSDDQSLSSRVRHTLDTMDGLVKERDRAKVQLQRLKEQMMQEQDEEEDKLNWRVDAEVKLIMDEQKQVEEGLRAQLRECQEEVSNLKKKSASWDHLLSVKDQEVENLQAVLGRLTYESEAAEQLRHDLRLANAKTEKVNRELTGAKQQLQEVQRAREEAEAAVQSVRSSMEQQAQQAKRTSEECVMLRRALEENMKRLNVFNSESNTMIDRRIVVKMLVTYFERGYSQEVLQLMSRMLGFTDEEQKAVGLVAGQRRGLLRSVAGMPFALVKGVGSALVGSSRSGGPGKEGAAGDNIADQWIEFLLHQAEREARPSESEGLSSSSGMVGGQASRGTLINHSEFAPVMAPDTTRSAPGGGQRSRLSQTDPSGTGYDQTTSIPSSPAYASTRHQGVTWPAYTGTGGTGARPAPGDVPDLADGARVPLPPASLGSQGNTYYGSMYPSTSPLSQAPPGLPLALSSKVPPPANSLSGQHSPMGTSSLYSGLQGSTSNKVSSSATGVLPSQLPGLSASSGPHHMRNTSDLTTGTPGSNGWYHLHGPPVPTGRGPSSVSSLGGFSADLNPPLSGGIYKGGPYSNTSTSSFSTASLLRAGEAASGNGGTGPGHQVYPH